MIVFLTLYLGLIVGRKPVAVMVEGPVSSVEFLLDGRRVGIVKRAPWAVDCDFSTDLRPHELVAVARDSKGQELGRTGQLLNVPRNTAEATILLENDSSGHPVAARIAGQSLQHSKPSRVAVTLDDQPLPVSEIDRFALPPYDREKVHFLSAELEFSEAESTKVAVAFGGGIAGDATSEMTAVPLILSKNGVLPPVDRLSGWFVADREKLRVLAVEEGPAQVLVVRGSGGESALKRLMPSPADYRRLRPDPISPTRSEDPETFRFSQSLGKDDRLRFLIPVARPASGSEIPAFLFPATRDYTKKDGGFTYLMTNLAAPSPSSSAPQRLADAVAVSALQSAGANLRRAVVLLAGKEPADASEFTPAAVRAYLESIRVPLSVWCVAPEALVPTRETWGEAEDVSTSGKFDAAVEKLKRELQQQRIIWLDGRLLPQKIELATPRADLRLAP